MTSEAPLDARFLAIAAPIPLQSLFSVVIPHVQSYLEMQTSRASGHNGKLSLQRTGGCACDKIRGGNSLVLGPRHDVQ